MSGARRLVFCFYVLAACVAGSASALAFAPAAHGWLALVCLCALLRMAALCGGAARAFGLGLAFGFSFYMAGLWWIYGALSGYIGLPAPAAAAITALFCLALALFPAAALGLGRALAGRNAAAVVFAAAGAWALAEWLRGFLFTGFPWLMLGYSQIPSGWLAGWAPVAGVLGVTLALALTAATLAAAPALQSRKRWAALALAPLLAAAPALANAWLWVSPFGELKITLLQGNVRQELKWERARVEQALADYLSMTKAAAGRVVIMPETALPMLANELPEGYAQALRQEAAKRYGAVVAGVFTEQGGELRNSALALTERGQSVYNKRHLTPFGEYLPFASRLAPLLEAAGIPYNHLAAGGGEALLALPDGMYAGVSICYEDAFGEKWRDQLPQAQFLINITNDGWFDGSFMARQHLQMSQARALEFGRYVARATNTGETAVINERGRIVSSLPPQTQGSLSEDIVLFRGATPYARVGDKAAALAAALALAAAVLVGRRRLLRYWRRQNWRARAGGGAAAKN